MKYKITIYDIDFEMYIKILNMSRDENVDCLWDFPLAELDYLMETTKEMEINREMALIDKRLYELPEDWRECKAALERS